jgi:hypothetical protein
MKKRAIIVLVAAVALSTVLIAGCTVNVNNTASPSPTTSASASPSVSISVKTVAPTALPLSTTDLSPFFTSYMQTEGYTIVTPFAKGVSASTGNDQYKGVVADGKYIYGASIEITTSSAQTANVFNGAISDAQQSGFTTFEVSNNSWIGYNSSNSFVAYVSQDTTDNFVIVLVATSLE